ncbi:MAG: hypothetical protein ACFFDN_17655 [Candidatus Hodarchaeota archaeon]
MKNRLELIKDACTINLIQLMGDNIIGYKFVVKIETGKNRELTKTANEMLEEIANEMNPEDFNEWCLVNKDLEFDEKIWNN